VDEHSSSYASSHSSDSEDDDIDVKPKWNNERQPVHSTPKGIELSVNPRYNQCIYSLKDTFKTLTLHSTLYVCLTLENTTTLQLELLFRYILCAKYA